MGERAQAAVDHFGAVAIIAIISFGGMIAMKEIGFTDNQVRWMFISVTGALVVMGIVSVIRTRRSEE